MVNKNLPGEPTGNSSENPTAGTDGGTEEHDRRAAQALAEYQDSFAAGKSSNWRQFLEEHPDFSHLRDEFEVLDQVDFLFDERSLGAPIAQLGDFSLIRVLGDGGMGVVYEAFQVSLARRVALKVISPQFLESVKASERFLKREIVAQGRLSHPNIVPIYSTGVEGKTPYFAMEYCKGETLQDWLDRLRAVERARRAETGVEAGAEAGAETDDEPVIRELYTPGDGAEFDDLVYDDTPFGGPLFVRTMTDATQYDGAGWDGPGLDGFLPEDRGNGVGVGAPPELPPESEPPPESAAAGGPDSISNLVRPLPSPTGDRDLSFDHCRRVAKSAIGVAKALYHAHVHDVIHRDIKPSNLIYDAEGNLRILDFGLALLLDESSRVTQISSNPMGTLPYMSPEQIQGQHKLYGPAMDLYSLGATLYEMVTGRPPFEATDFSGFLRKVVGEEPEPPSRRNRQVPGKLEEIILRLLEKQPERRYPTAHVLALDLQNFLDGNGLIIRPDSRVVKAARTAWKFRKELFATACALMLVVVSGLLYWRNAKDELNDWTNQYNGIVEAAAATIQGQQIELSSVVSAMRVKRVPRDPGAPLDAGRDIHRGGDDMLFDVEASDYQKWVRSSSDAAVVRRAKVEQALDKLSEAVGLLPDLPEADFYASQGLRLLGKLPEAQKKLDSVLRKQPNSLLALGLRMQLFAAEGRRRDAREVEKRFSSIVDKTGVAWATPWLNVLKAEMETNWEVVASSCAEVALNLPSEPDDWQVKGLKREILLKKDVARLRVSSSRKARRQVEKAAELLNDVNNTPVLDPWPGSPPMELALLQGKTRFELGEREQAEKIFRGLFDKAKRSRGKNPRLPLEVARAVTTVYQDLDDQGRALMWANEVYKLEPFNAESSMTVGFLRMQKDHHIGPSQQEENCIEACQWFDQASRLSPSDARPLVAQAICLETMDMTAAAERKFQELGLPGRVQLSPAYYVWAWFLSKQGKPQEAQQKCLVAIQTDPTNALAHNLLGQLLDAQGKGESALEEYRKATELDPRFGVAHYHIGWAYHRQYLFSEAASHYEKAIANGIADPVVLGNLAACLQMLKGPEPDQMLKTTFDDAIAAYQEALRSEPENPVTNLSLGSAYEWRYGSTKNDEDRLNAEASYGRAVELDKEWLRARFYWAGAQDRLMRKTDAFDQYAEILNRAPDYFAARQLMANISLEENWPLPTGEDLWTTISQLEDAVALSPDAESAGERLLGMCRRTLAPDLATYGSIDALFDGPEMLIPEGARWARWPDPREEPPAAWNEFVFDDGQWVAGPGSFGYPAETHGIGTALDDMKGSYDSVYLRHRFAVADRTRLGRLILAVRGDDGYAAYLNGALVARQGVKDRLHSAASRVLGIAVHCEQYAIDSSLLHDGENVLAIHGMNDGVDNEDFFLGATLKSAIFVDPEGRKRAVQEAYTAFQAVASGPTAPARKAFFEGRLHQLWSNHGDAVKSFDEVLAADQTRPEPFLRSAESLVALGRAGEGEAILRQGMETVSTGYDRLLAAWFRCVMLGAGWSEGKALEALEAFPEKPKTLPEVRESYIWLLTDLKENKAVRINCGGLAYKAGGKSWGRDRFHRGGQERYLNDLQREIAASSDPDAALSNRPLYLNGRFFDSGAPIMPGYSIPLSRGTYLVTLHFIEGWDEPDKERRRFDVLIEGDVMLPDCEPMRSGYGVPDLHELQVVVEDGALEVEFRRHSTDPDQLSPQISAIEIVPVRP